ncbi:MAG: hypothetical protein M3M85_00450 [bacterium]|nr:hypothetical protein [bacterium]
MVKIKVVAGMMWTNGIRTLWGLFAKEPQDVEIIPSELEDVMSAVDTLDHAARQQRPIVVLYNNEGRPEMVLSGEETISKFDELVARYLELKKREATIKEEAR